MIVFSRGQVLDVRAVTFGVDGTLYPLGLHQLRWTRFYLRNRRFLRALLAAREELRERGRVGDFPAQQAKTVAASLGLSPTEAAGRIDALVRQEWLGAFENVEPFPGLSTFLEALVSRDVLLGIISDGHAEEKLERLGLAAYPWKVIVTPDSTGAMKPHRALFRAAQVHLGVPAGKILHVGSRVPLDVVGAHRSGFHCALKQSGIADRLVDGVIRQRPKIPHLSALGQKEEVAHDGDEQVPDMTFRTFLELKRRLFDGKG